MQAKMRDQAVAGRKEENGNSLNRHAGCRKHTVWPWGSRGLRRKLPCTWKLVLVREIISFWATSLRLNIKTALNSPWHCLLKWCTEQSLALSWPRKKLAFYFKFRLHCQSALVVFTCWALVHLVCITPWHESAVFPLGEPNTEVILQKCTSSASTA